jgi:enoyl-CoA hydratase
MVTAHLALWSCATQWHGNVGRKNTREGAMAESGLLRIENNDAVRIISMNRPDKLNALNTDLLLALRDALDAADQDDGVRALVLTGEGRGFSAGADLSEFRDERTPEQVKRNALRSSLMSAIQLKLRTLSKPVVAAVHGAAIGGGAAFAICCDMVVVGTNLKFGYPELKHHLTPTGVSTSLIKQVGPKIAFEMLSLGATFGADDVLRLGLANRAVAPEAVLPTAIDVAKAWCENDAAQLAATKNMFYRMLELSFEGGLALGKDVSAAMRAGAK